ncbi:eCIS core domain-containing protein [Streptomyces sp. NPDC001415]
MLRAAGHPGAQERHQHGAGCGHQQAEEPQVQRSAVHDVLRSGGRPLDSATRTDMESRLGADFSDVRIHNDSAAKASAAEVGARAYTSGSHVVIGDGGADKHTLAHELTHVIQQRQGPVAGTDNGSGLKVSDPSDRFEKEAEANATRVMSSAPVQRTEQRRTQDGTGAGSDAPARTPQTAAVQRTIRITPGMYERGLGGDALTLPQLKEYFFFAVRDDAMRAAKVQGKGSPIAKDLKSLVANLKSDAADPAAIRTEMDALVTAVNGVLEQEQAYLPDYTSTVEGTRHVPGPGVGTVPNSMTRYSQEGDKSHQYAHSRKTADQLEEPRWPDEETMHRQVAAELGPHAAPVADDPRPRTHGERALKRLDWQQAQNLLPRPLLNLIFDVRYQLEADPGSQVVVDERTPEQQRRKDKSPSAPGTLRSWHQDDSGKLPANGFDADEIPAHATALHNHYATASQSGAGSSVQNAATAPRGFAEYTGAGSRGVHDVKVVLDYIQKRVYLTLTHYQYWALIPQEGGYTFWPSGTQDQEQALGNLQNQPNGAQGVLMSPWLEVLVS